MDENVELTRKNLIEKANRKLHTQQETKASSSNDRKLSTPIAITTTKENGPTVSPTTIIEIPWNYHRIIIE